MAFGGTRRCPECSRNYQGTPTQTATGRWVCPDCAQGVAVAALSIMDSPGDPAPVGEYVGVRKWLRLRRRQRARRED